MLELIYPRELVMPDRREPDLNPPENDLEPLDDCSGSVTLQMFCMRLDVDYVVDGGAVIVDDVTTDGLSVHDMLECMTYEGKPALHVLAAAVRTELERGW